MRRSLSLPTSAALTTEQLLIESQDEANAGNFERAAKFAREALKRGVVLPPLHDIVGMALMEGRHFEEAIAEFGRSLELEPDNNRAMVNVGLCLLQLERNADAHDVFLTVLRRDRKIAAAHYGFGTALHRLEDIDGARREFLFAIAEDPNHASALAALATICQSSGQTAEARGYAERALRAEPMHVEAAIVLARIENVERNFAQAAERIRKVLGIGAMNSREAAAALIALGDALDGLGDYGAAFEAYSKGKGVLEALFAPQFAAPGAESAAEETDRMARGFAEANLRLRAPGPAAPAEGEPATHVFLVGFPRSGTTLLEQVLASHPGVVSLEERPTLPAIEQAFPDVAAGFARLASDEAALAEHRAAYWELVRSNGVDPAGKVFIDKLPLNTARLPIIQMLFPNAKILFAVRDPRDVVLSCFRRGFRMNPAMYEFVALQKAARYYDVIMRAALIYRDRLPLDLHEVRYEALVENFEAEARAACAFLGIDWSDDMRSFADRARERRIRTPSAPQVRRGLYKDALAQWRNYADALRPVLPVLEPWIEHFGYPRG